jgi:hypothetical protein
MLREINERLKVFAIGAQSIDGIKLFRIAAPLCLLTVSLQANTFNESMTRNSTPETANKRLALVNIIFNAFTIKSLTAI